MSYDPSTTRGKVRLLINDVQPAAEFFSDAEIDAFLAMELDDLYASAAMALDTIATNEALAAKVVKTLDLETSTDKLMAALRARANDMRLAARDVGEDYAFDVAEMVTNDFGARQQLLDVRLREQGA